MNVDINTKILVVDDQATLLKLMQRMLENLGFQKIYKALDGQAALKIIHDDGPFGLIITDMEMGEMSGKELCIAARRIEECEELPFILASGREASEIVAIAEDAHMNGYLRKPFSAKELGDVITSVLGG